MQMNVHLNFQGNCAEAFEFYKTVFGAQKSFSMNYADAPSPGAPVPPDWKDKIMHTSIPLGDALLMGCDAPGRPTPIGGFQISVLSKDEAEVKRIYDALQAGGSVQMPMAPTFWSPMFGMCTDKFGVAWMIGMPGAGQE
jgi:PhnB protein